MRLRRRRVGRGKVRLVMTLLKRKYKRFNVRLKSKTKLRYWIPFTKIRNSLK